MIRVLLADDQALVRAGFRMILRAEPDIEVVGEAGQGLEAFDLDEYVYEALRAGASGFLLKDAPEEQLVAGIKVVADGGSLFAPAVTKRLIERFAGTAPAQMPAVLADLTPREVEVLRLVARGLANAEIASELVVSEHTAKTHVAHIL